MCTASLDGTILYNCTCREGIICWSQRSSRNTKRICYEMDPERRASGCPEYTACSRKITINSFNRDKMCPLQSSILSPTKGIYWGEGGEGERWGAGRDCDDGQAEPAACEIAHRHIPIDTSLCALSAQVRIYGFVATGLRIFFCVGVWRVWKWNVKTISPTKGSAVRLLHARNVKTSSCSQKGKKLSSVFSVLLSHYSTDTMGTPQHLTA